MESRVLAILDELEATDVATLEAGVDLLDGFLYELLPRIRQYHDTGTDGEIAKFKSLQDNFEFNIVARLLNYYRAVDGQWGEHTIRANQCLQGLLLTHTSSQKLFHRRANLQLIIDMLDSSDKDVIISAITTIIHVLLKDLTNFRTFESLGGCSKIINHLDLDESMKIEQLNNHNRQQQNLNFKIIEFLIFYLIDESNMDGPTKSVAEKSSHFKKDFPEIDQLMKSLQELQVET